MQTLCILTLLPELFHLNQSTLIVPISGKNFQLNLQEIKIIFKKLLKKYHTGVLQKTVQFCIRRR